MTYKKLYKNGKYIKDEHRYIMEQYIGRELKIGTKKIYQLLKEESNG